MKRFPGILCGKQSRKLEKKLKLLETTEVSFSLETYYGKKFSRMLQLLCVGGLVLGVLGLGFSGKVSWFEKAVILRPGSGEGTLETELQASIQDGAPLRISVVIEERKYSDAETKELFAGILRNLEASILGENTSLKEVRTDLNLPDSFENGAVTAVWEVEPSEYMDNTGRFLKEAPERGIQGFLRLTLKYEEEELLQEYPVLFLPPLKTEEEQQAATLKAMVEEAAAENPEEEQVVLPETLNGQTVKWGVGKQNLLIPGIFFLIIGLIYFYERDDQRIEEEEKRRQCQLVMDYPAILYKMSMLLAAGMTIRGAFFKIAFFYKEQEKKEVRYAYEAMLLTCYEMQNGVGEAAAYENFGQRCQEMRYLKLGSLLSQSLKKGSDGLAALLEEEARAGMEERKNLARKLGEEAGTKLLFPMLLMLVLVMAILMVPAMISF